MSATAEIRSGKLVLYCGVAENRRPVGKGVCCWCGDPIVLADPTDYRRRTRTRHRGDEHEVGDRNCHKLFMASYCYTARELVERRGDPCCVDCGDIGDVWQPNEDGVGGAWVNLGLWEADHRIALIDGGAHDPTNIERRCRDCHSRKTKREATARAERRRFALAVQLPAPQPSPQLEFAA